MIGINDLGYGETPEETSRRTADILDELHDILPQARLILMSVLPAETVDDGDVTELNALNEELVGNLSYAEFLDIHDEYLDESSQRNESLYDADGVHLNGYGYSIWINALANYMR